MDIAWRLGVSGDFTTASNWNPEIAPGTTDDVTIAVSGTYTVTSTPNQTVDSLSILDRRATLFITDLSSFSTNNGISEGTIIVDSGSSLSFQNPLDTSSPGSFSNSGTLEATNTQKLSTGGTIILPDETITNTRRGMIEATGANTSVILGEFGNTIIVGGTLKAEGTNAAIVMGGSGSLTSDGTIRDGTTLDGTQPGNPVTIEGNVVSTSEAAIGLLGTIDNRGVITMEGGAFPWLVCEGNVTLEGGGDIVMTNDTPVIYLAPSIFGGALTNVDNTISGTGVIGQMVSGAGLGSFVGTFVNEARGTINANASGPLLITGVGPDTNAGVMEATQGGALLIQNVTINNFLNCAKGRIDAGAKSTIALENATITGGLMQALSGSMIEAEKGSSTISGTHVENAGTIGAEGANLTIIGNVNNDKGNLDANNGSLVIDGAVRHGTATLEGSGQIEFGGPSSADVTFAVGSDATLRLDVPSAFKGTIAGFTIGDYIDLPNINFADDPTLSYSSKTHVLTISDRISCVTDTIRFEGSVGAFTAQSDGTGGTLISDPTAPEVANTAGTITQMQHFLTQAMASFSPTALAASDVSKVSFGAHGSLLNLIAPPHH